MYIPKDFAETDGARLAALIEGHGFALLVTSGPDGLPVASHLAFLYDRDRGENGTLLGHMARANPQWKRFRDDAEALVIFWGPHAYVSPSWYEAQPSVPTWNYATVHAYGRPRLVEGGEALRALLARLVEENEAGFESPWRMDLPKAYEDRMIQGIVGFEIEIGRLEGKFKLSQNRDATDRASVARQLRAGGDDDAAGIARLMDEQEADG